MVFTIAVPSESFTFAPIAVHWLISDAISKKWNMLSKHL
jgi:hypothetical protein